jgi:hypothetical protein
MQAEHAKIKGYDTIYRVNYFENIILRTEFSSDVRAAQFVDGLNGNKLNINPIAEYKLGFSVDYKWIALGISFTPEFLKDSQFNEEQNESTSFGMSINFFYSDRWRQEISYNYYKGFYSNIELFTNETINIILLNTTIKSFDGSTFFIVNKNYSFRAHYAQTERQLKSAGSFIPRIRYSFSEINPNFDSIYLNNEVEKINNIDIITQIGYLYTFVYKQKWFATLGAHSGVGYNNSRYFNINSKIESFSNFSFALNGEISLGYNSYRWFFGSSYNLRNYNFTNNIDDKVFRGSDYFNIYLGYRFNDNKPMRKFFGWFEDTFGI